MPDPAHAFGAGESRKSEADDTADAMDNLLRDLTTRSVRDDGIRDVFEGRVIGQRRVGGMDDPIQSLRALGRTISGVMLDRQIPLEIQRPNGQE